MFGDKRTQLAVAVICLGAALSLMAVVASRPGETVPSTVAVLVGLCATLHFVPMVNVLFVATAATLLLGPQMTA